MQVQRIANYTTQYSANKTQKTNNNPNFGKIEVVNLRRSTSLVDWVCSLAGRLWQKIDNAVGIDLASPKKNVNVIGFEDFENSGGVASLETHFKDLIEVLSEKHKERLQLLLTRTHDNEAVTAFITNGDSDVLGRGRVIATGDPVKAGKQAITNAFDDYNVGAGLDRLYRCQHRGALAQVAKASNSKA